MADRKDKKKSPATPSGGTPARRVRSAEANLNAWAFKMVMERAKNDIGLQDAIIAHECGIDVNQIDRLAVEKLELKITLMKKYGPHVLDDPEVAKRYKRWLADQLMDIKDPDPGTEPTPESKEPPKDPIDAAIEYLEKMERFKQAVGIKKPSAAESLAESILNPGVLTEALKTISAFFGQRPPPEALRVYVLPVDGKMVEVTKSEFDASFNPGAALFKEVSAELISPAEPPGADADIVKGNSDLPNLPAVSEDKAA